MENKKKIIEYYKDRDVIRKVDGTLSKLISGIFSCKTPSSFLSTSPITVITDI